MRRVALVVVAALIAFPLTTAVAGPARLRRTPSPTLAASDALARAFQNGRLSEAELALERARSLFELRKVRAEYGDVARPDPHSASLFLTDLALSLRDLSGGDRGAAQDILARPTEGGTSEPFGGPYDVREEAPFCSINVCIHYVTSTGDAPSSPTWHQEASTIFQDVWNAEITQMGFRAPKSDLSSDDNGGNRKLDVYIKDLGDFGVYGYCTTDDPRTEIRTVFWNFSAFCVVDDDFTPDQYNTGANGLNALKVTAAHEFFHAVQIGYDAGEDGWLREGTAVWMEDEVYDEIDDSAQYLRAGPLAFPQISLDAEPPEDSQFVSFPYGAWVFFRHLSEQPLFGPAAILDIWTRLDSKTRDHDDVYSVQAIQQMAAAQGTSLRDQYATFAAHGVAPGAFFEEGIENQYPPVPMDQTVELTTAAPTVASTTVNGVDHLTSRYFAFTPGADTPTDGQMTIAVDLSDLVTGSEATVVIEKPGVIPIVQPMTLDTEGRGNQTVEFGQGSVSRVVLVLSNGSSRFRDCFTGSVFSCNGTPTDDNQVYAYAAQLGATAPPVIGGEPPTDTTAPRITNVSDSPDPFRPNGTRFLKIKFTLDEASAFNARIFNPNGTRVLQFRQSLTPGAYVLTWNGVFRNKLTKTGKHTYKLSSVDVAGNQSSVKKGTFTVKR